MINLIVRTVIMHFWFQLVCALGVEVVINSKADTNHFLFERLGFPSWRIMKLYTVSLIYNFSIFELSPFTYQMNPAPTSAPFFFVDIFYDREKSLSF
jgi:hypothetical protein